MLKRTLRNRRDLIIQNEQNVTDTRKWLYTPHFRDMQPSMPLHVMPIFAVVDLDLHVPAKSPEGSNGTGACYSCSGPRPSPYTLLSSCVACLQRPGKGFWQLSVLLWKVAHG